MAIHTMNEARRSAFNLMRAQERRLGLKAPMRCYFRDDVMCRGLAANLAKLGWLTVLPGYKGRPSQIHLTDIGMWVLGGAS